MSSRLAARGFVVVAGGATEAAEGAATLLGRVAAQSASKFIASARDAGRDERLRLDRQVKSVLAAPVRDLLDRQRIFMAGVLYKGSRGPAVPFHQDLTYTDESIHRSCTCWVPLVDVNRDNGALRVVPGSHRWTTGIRPAGPGAAHIGPQSQAVLGQHALTLEVTAGSMVIWDNALLHGSAPNRTNRPRPAVAATLTSIESAIYYFHSDAAGSLEGFVIDDDYLGQEEVFLSRPVGYARVRPWGKPVREIEIPPRDWGASGSRGRGER